MSIASIKKRLEAAMLHDGPMRYELYEFELEERIAEFRQSLADDHDDYLFVITENSDDVAMILIDQAGALYINEEAREKLKTLWPATYTQNLKRLIPAFAKQLHEDSLPINGVKIMRHHHTTT